MNKLIKVAFGIQAFIAVLWIINNLYIGSTFNRNAIPIMLYASIIIGVFLTWKVFDKTLKKSTRTGAFIVGTVPLCLILLFLILVRH